MRLKNKNLLVRPVEHVVELGTDGEVVKSTPPLPGVNLRTGKVVATSFGTECSVPDRIVYFTTEQTLFYKGEHLDLIDASCVVAILEDGE
jgi:hypothetical protein